MAVAIVCRKCGHERQLSLFEIRAGTWKRKPCPSCGHVDGGIEKPPKDAA